MKKLYMAYGSNLNLGQMARRCPTARVVGTTMLEGYQLLFNGVATIVPREGAVVPVGIWEIDKRCEEALDRYEGYPTLYRKETLTVELNGEQVDAFGYIMNRDRPALPAYSYYETIEDGYNDVGLDTAHLRKAIEETLALMK